MHTIYGLFDPRTGHLRYVGRTTNLVRRFKAHCTSSDTINKRKYAWIQDLRRLGLLPEIQELDTADDDTVTDLENFYIGYFRMLGADLTNGENYTPYRKPTRPNKEAINLRLDPWIIEKVDETAAKSYISRSAWISMTLTIALEKGGY
jgi:hypothetical protein